MYCYHVRFPRLAYASAMAAMDTLMPGIRTGNFAPEFHHQKDAPFRSFRPRESFGCSLQTAEALSSTTKIRSNGGLFLASLVTRASGPRLQVYKYLGNVEGCHTPST